MICLKNAQFHLQVWILQKYYGWRFTTLHWYLCWWGEPTACENIIEQSDCLIGIGARFTDVGSAVFTHQIETGNYIEIKSYGLNIFGQDFPGIEIGQLLVELNKKLRHVNRQFPFLKNNLRK